MTKFFIAYNPYLVECVFKKNGNPLNSNSKIGAKADQRLQVLLGESVNWKGLPEEIACACDDDEVELTFRGRKIDYDDLKYTFDLYKGRVKFELKFEESKNDADIITELDTIFKEIKEKNFPEFCAKNEDGRDVFDAYEEVKNGIFEVSVIATMSSGKSTLINSLLHTELLPSENQACTATVCRILDNDSMEQFEAECYDSDEKTVVHPRTAVTSELLKKYNADKNVTYIDIEGDVPAISSDKIKLCLRDTPGPNNSRNENHGTLTNSIIRRTNAVVLYVMNATQMGIKDDKSLLQDISAEMKRDGKQSRDKFIFVINKCDELDEEKGETVEELLDDVREYLKEFGSVDPILIPTSARLALLIRKAQNGEKLSRMERKELSSVDDFVESDLLHFEKYATLTPTVREKLKNDVERFHQDEETWDMEILIHTGVPAVEETIREYIDKYAYPMKIKDAIEDIVRILDELNMKAKFEDRIANDSSELDKVRKQIEDAKVKHAGSKEVYDLFKEKINNLKLDSINEADVEFPLEMQLQKMVEKYDDRSDKERFVEKDEADRLILEFQAQLDALQKDCEGQLNRRIDEEIFNKCREILDEYTSMVNAILGDFEIEGYDFRRISSFERIRIADINDIKQRYVRDRYRDEIRWKDNPERSGFWGKFKFWKPKEVSYTVSVKDGVEVNVIAVIVNIVGSFSESLKKNIRIMFQKSDEQVEEYKVAFNENIDRLNYEIGKSLDKLDQDTKESEKLQQRVKENKEKAIWIERRESDIRTLLSF